MSVLFNTVLATSAVAFFALIGIFTVSLTEKTLHKILFVLIAFSAGTILGAVNFDLLPKAIELVEGFNAFIYLTLGFLSFFFLERFIYWYHGHPHERDICDKTKEGKVTKNMAYLNLLGDGVHNFVDGMVIAVSFLTGFPVGLAATIAVIFHELPQEIGDYGILIYAGFKRRSALLLNFAVALMVYLGGIVAMYYIENVETLTGLLLALSAGGFLYLGASELIPELHKERDFRRSLIQFIIFIAGMILIWSLRIIFHG